MTETTRPVAVRARAGFTLIELILAMLIVATGVLSMLATGQTVVRLMSGSRQATLAATLAQSRIEALRALDCSAPQLASGTVVTRGITHRITVTTPVSAANSMSVREIIDSVSYRNDRGITQTQVYSTVRPCP